jgi:hypothetical protein
MPCLPELISQISQSFNNVFLSQQISEQYFHTWLISQANRVKVFAFLTDLLEWTVFFYVIHFARK